MTVTPLILAGSASLAVALMVAGIARAFLTARVRVKSRLAALAAASPYQREDGDVLLIRDRRDSSIPLLDALMQGRGFTQKTRLALERAGVPLRVGEYFAMRALIAMLGTLVGSLAMRMVAGEGATVIGGAAGLIVGGLLPPLYLKRRAARRGGAIEVQLVEFCDLMASMLESGFGYLQALTSTAAQIGQPLSGELSAILDSVRLGGNIDEAFDELNQRLNSRDFDMVATSIAIQRQSGGNLAEILRRVAQTIRDRQTFRREIRALTSRERFSAMLLTGFPFVLALALAALLPDTFARLLTEPAGRIILGIAVTLDAVGYLIIKRVIRLEI